MNRMTPNRRMRKGMTGAEARNPTDVIAPFSPIMELPTPVDSRISESRGEESPNVNPKAAAAT